MLKYQRQQSNRYYYTRSLHTHTRARARHFVIAITYNSLYSRGGVCPCDLKLIRIPLRTKHVNGEIGINNDVIYCEILINMRDVEKYANTSNYS